MTRAEFQEALLQIMERKKHWAWAGFTSGLVPKELLHHHFEQEYETYVRDFPVLVGWAYVQCPFAEVRCMLAENIYEEETGGLVAGRPHPELFLEYPRGLEMDLQRFKQVRLAPAARAYRDLLDDAVRKRGWEAATAVATLFIEGTEHERGEVDAKAAKRPTPALSEHPLVKHYGLPERHLALTKAHRQVEGEHRAAAWKTILDFVKPESYAAVLTAMEHVLIAWQNYRDEVAAACGLRRDDNGKPARR